MKFHIFLFMYALLIVDMQQYVDSFSINMALNELKDFKNKLMDNHFGTHNKDYYKEGSCAAKLTERVIGGKEVNKGDIPWQVSLQTAAKGHFCGGAILDNYWIITAAHCVNKFETPSALQIVAGEHNLDITEGTEQVKTAKKILYHKSFDSESHENDIALVRLEEPLVLDGYTGHICMPNQRQKSEGRRCTVSGWGTKTENTTHQKASTVLQEVQVPVVKRKRCSKSYEGIIEIKRDMLCAGEEQGGKDACQGDSGGPLACLTDDGYIYLAGIVSFGNGCARPGFFGVYTDVAKYIDWFHYLHDKSFALYHSTTMDKQLNITEVVPLHKSHGVILWSVSIQTIHREHFCGGAILDKQWVITAAHCLHNAVENPSEVVVVAGESNLAIKEGVEQVILAKRIIIHELFKSETHENDIALVELAAPLTYNSFTRHICLPEETQQPGGSCILSGWNSTSHGIQKVSDNFTTVAMSGVPFKECYMDYLSIVNIKKYMVCAKEHKEEQGKKIACQGDSGAPLVCETEDGSPYIAGIAAFDKGCPKTEEYHGVYTGIPSFLTWIQDNAGIDTDGDEYDCHEDVRLLMRRQYAPAEDPNVAASVSGSCPCFLVVLASIIQFV